VTRTDFDKLDLATLKQRRSQKWSTFPRQILPVWVSEMDYPLADPIREVLLRAAEFDDVGYPISPGKTGLPDVFAERMRERFAWDADPSRCEIITDVVQGMYVALMVLSNPGEGAVVQTPIYPPFLGAVADCKRELVENRLVSGPDGYEIDFDALRTSIDARTRVFMLCNPHNPTGRVLRREELEEIAHITCENDLIVVSDEIHADLVFDARKHIPIASLGPEIAQRTITLTSATKAFNIAGLRCAVAHFGSLDLQNRFNSIPRNVRGGIGLLGVEATLAAWQYCDAWLKDVRSHLEANRGFLGRFLADRIPEAVHHTPEASYLAWIDFEKLAFTNSPWRHFYDEQQIALTDGRAFGRGFGNFARLNFATSRPILSEALERVEKACQNPG